MIRFAALLCGALVSVAQAEEVATDDVAFDGVDVAFLGEVHDNPRHHAAQAWWVAKLGPKALVFEMLTPSLALGAGSARGDAKSLAEALHWEERGWPDFSLYYPIFQAAPEAAIFGGEVPRDEARRAVTEGAAAVMGGSAALFGLDAPLPEDQQRLRIEGQAEAHCGALPEEMLPGMVEAQRVRDAALAVP